MAKLKSNLAYALVFVTLVTFGASQFGAVGVAWAATMYFLIVGLGHIYIAIRPNEGTFADVWSVYRSPCLAGGLSIGTAMLLAAAVPNIPRREIWQLVITLSVGGGGYVLLISNLARETSAEILMRVRNALSRSSA